MQDSRRRQEEMYHFPYHHVNQFDPVSGQGFAQHRANPAGFRYAAYLMKILRELERTEFATLVDFGCGDGFFLRQFAERFPHEKGVGVDIAAQAIEFARLFNQGNANEFLCRDIVREGLPQRYDAGTSIAVIEHIPPDELPPFIAAMHRHLKPGGTMLVAVPSHKLPVHKISRHYQHFCEDSLRQALAPWFRPVETGYITRQPRRWKYLSWLVYNRFFILNHRGLLSRFFRGYLRHCLEATHRDGLMVWGRFVAREDAQ